MLGGYVNIFTLPCTYMDLMNTNNFNYTCMHVYFSSGSVSKHNQLTDGKKLSARIRKYATTRESFAKTSLW
jgi:hypothetical protein